MSDPSTERRLAAIMFTDIVGYTALMAESEQKGLRVRERHRALVRPLVEQYHGESIEARGDESLSVFPTALDAVNCALAIEESVRDDDELKLHVGIHLGDVVVQDGEVSGDGVNIASRICALSEGGGICVSNEVQHSIQNQENIETRPLGEHELKNVPRAVGVFAVTGTAAPPRPVTVPSPRHGGRPQLWAASALVALLVVVLGAWWLTRPAADSAPIRSIAVLPLENFSGDPEHEYFADGMTEAVISRVARLKALTVISRTSVMQYKGARKPLPEIAQELGVEGIIEGTVMQAGERVRITVQLIDARSDSHVWNDTYDRELSNVLALQSEVARAVADQLRLELSSDERGALTPSRVTDPRAYDAYLRALQLRAGTPHLVSVWGPQAIAHLERAVELDPDFAEAYAQLAQIRSYLGFIGWNLKFRGEFPKARAAAQRALALDDRLGEAHAALGQVRLWYDWDFAGARRAYERALQLSPNDPWVLRGYCMYLYFVRGPSPKALELLDHLLRVAPLDLFFRAERPRYFMYAREYERAIQEAQLVKELAPDWVDLDVGSANVLLGRFEAAHREYVRVAKRCGEACAWEVAARERGWADGGIEGSLRAYAEAASRREGPSPWLIAVGHAFVGDSENAFEWLERGYQERDPLMVATKAYPPFDPLRSDPRFDDLLRRIGFPES